MNPDVIIVGAGACGLMVARELGKAGKKVLILEARDRVGGRIMPLDEKKFGYPAQGGAEFVHGEAPITKSLAKDAGMTLVLTKGDMWSAENGQFLINHQVVPNQEVLHQKLRELKSDMPISEFLNKYFPDEQYASLKYAITRMVEGYDAADSNLISTFVLRDEWLGGEEWLQYRIEEGYGVLLKYLKSECEKYGVEIKLSEVVKEVGISENTIVVRTDHNDIYKAEKVVVTVPLPVIKDIEFTPAIPEKIKASDMVGFGGVIKILLKFKSKWWINASGHDFTEMDFLYSKETVPVWWTQYLKPIPLLTGWLAGPNAKKFLKNSKDEIVRISIESLANIFNVEKKFVQDELIESVVINWPADKFSKGAYSYFVVGSQSAYEELVKPVNNKLYFAGEALYSGLATATVEGALGSGLETAQKILGIREEE